MLDYESNIITTISMADPKTPKPATVRKLFALSMNRCAFQGCLTPVVDSNTSTITAEICHIRAQNSGGPRYDKHQTSAARHAAENLILMCSVHHKIIDAKENLEQYSVAYLTKLKLAHEDVSRTATVATPALSDALINALQRTVQNHFTSNTHMDFRGASFKAGGEGGQWGGGGGNGGVINIVGVTPTGFHESIDSSGQDGRAPGAGGGGAGAVVFSGRAGDENDLTNGLKISSVFIANAIDSKNGLFSVLGGGWAAIELPSLISNFQINVQCVFETGNIAPDTMLRINYSILRPNDDIAVEAYFDLSVNFTKLMVKRYPVAFHASFNADMFGVWQILLSTGQLIFSRHSFEICQKIS